MAFPGRVNKTDQGGLKLGLLVIIIGVTGLVVWMVWDVAQIINSPSVQVKTDKYDNQRGPIKSRGGTVSNKVNNDLKQLMHGDILGHDVHVQKEMVNNPAQYKDSVSSDAPGDKGYYK